MKAKILNGKKLAEKILANLKKEVKKSNFRLRLAVVQVGENPVSQIFINQKKKACQGIGIDFKLYQFKKRTSVQGLKKKIAKITSNSKNSGVIIQLPLPKYLNTRARQSRVEGGNEAIASLTTRVRSKKTSFSFRASLSSKARSAKGGKEDKSSLATQEILNTIPKEKDVDVLSETSLGKFYTLTLPILPPTVKGIIYLLAKYRIKVKGKHVVVVGVGRLVGNPLAIWLLHKKATVSAVTEFTKETSFFTKKADILVTGVGKPNLIRANMVKKGVIVIDAGCSIWKGKLVGDVDFENVSKKASYITPVPGGVGPMTVACLLENLVRLQKFNGNS